MNLPYLDGSVEAEFDIGNATEGTTALGAVTALKTMPMPDDTKRLYFGYLLLQEMLQRSGYHDLRLPERLDDLDPETIWLLRAGRAAREELRYSDPGQIYDLVRNIRCPVLLYGDSLADLLGDPIQHLMLMRVIMHWRYQPTVQFIYPTVEELLMILDCFYYGYKTSLLDFLLPGNKSPPADYGNRPRAKVAFRQGPPLADSDEKREIIWHIRAAHARLLRNRSNRGADRRASSVFQAAPGNRSR